MQTAAQDPPSTPAEGLPSVAAIERHMVRLRLVSARMVQLQREGRIASHTSSIGEEGAIVGAVLGARDGDWIFPGVREWGAALVRGLPIATYVHHVFGTARDPAKGHSAPDHPPARALRVVPASGTLGAHTTQAVGAAWAARIRKDDVAAIALFGESVTSTGDFHNALNFAGVFKAPCVLVARRHGPASIADKAVAYGVASARVDGRDPARVAAVVRAAVLRASEGKGATLVEVETHPPEGDVDLRADFVALGEDDPIAGTPSPDLVRDVRAEIEAAVAAAEQAGPPAPESIFDDVYATLPAHLLEQRRALARRT